MFYRTGKLPNSLDISPGCTLKLNEGDQNLFILNDSNRLKILFNLEKSNFGGIIELTVSPSDSICDFKCIGRDKVLILHSNNRISLYSFNNVSGILLDEKDMNHGFNKLDYQSISLALDSKHRFFACLLKGSGGRPDKIVSGEIKADEIFTMGTFDCNKASLSNHVSCKNFLNELKFTFLDMSNSPPSLIALNMDFTSEHDHPILLCTDSGNVRKILACKLVGGRIHESDSVPNNKMGFTSRRYGEDLFTIDQYGVISRFQMGGTKALRGSSSVYGPKVITTSAGNVRTRVSPSPQPMRTQGGIRQSGVVYGHTNTLNPSTANYLQNTANYIQT